MLYNIAKNAMIYVDTVESTVSIPQYDLIRLLEDRDEPIVSISGTDKLVLECDLGQRIHIYDVFYNYKSNTIPAGLVSVFYKNESFQSYVSLTTFADSEGYRTTVSGMIGEDPFAPRYIRIEHDLTSEPTSVSGSLYSVEVLNDDRIVDFGADGLSTQTEINVARGGAAEVISIPIYNSGSEVVDAFISIEPKYNDTDKIVSLGLANTGPWKYALDSNSLIADSTNFNHGFYNNTSVYDSRLTVTSWRDVDGSYTYNTFTGEYTSKVFSLTPETQNRILLDVDRSRGGSLTFDDAALTDTVEVRSSNVPPVNYHVYRELYNTSDSNYKYLRFRDRWAHDGSLKENHAWTIAQCSSQSEWRDYFLTMDPATERTAGIIYHYSTYYSIDPQLSLFNSTGTTATVFNLATNSDPEAMNFNLREVILDSSGGTWIYFYCQTYSAAQFVDATGYYLAYFNSAVTNTFKYFFSEDFIGDMSVDYTTAAVWYTYPTSETIVKLSPTGDTLVTLSSNDVDFLGGITVLPDGTVWYANDGDLIHITSTGSVIDKITGMLEPLNVYGKLAYDPADTTVLWALNGFNVSRIYTQTPNRGETDLSINLEGAFRITPTKTGCWVWCADITGAGYNRMKFISKTTRRVDLDYKVNPTYTTSSSIPSASMFAPVEFDWSDSKYANKMPIALDNVWSTLPYRTVPVENFIFSEDDRYYQVRLKFTAADAVERYALPEGTSFIKEDYFDQPDGQPQNIQMWGRWSSDEKVYVQNSKLILDPPISGETWIDTYKRLVVTGNFDLRFYFSVGESSPTGKAEIVPLYIYRAGSSGNNAWLRVKITIPINPSTTNSYVSMESSAGASNNVSLGTNFNSQNIGIRITFDGTTYRYYAWTNGAWSGSNSFNASTANLGSYQYIRLATTAGGSKVYVDGFSVYSGTVYYYSGAPHLNSIYFQEALRLEDVHPGVAKNVYVRTQVDLSHDVTSLEEVDLRVRWRQPLYNV